MKCKEKLHDAYIKHLIECNAGQLVVTRMDTPKYGETLKFMYVKYQLILSSSLLTPKVYQV